MRTVLQRVKKAEVKVNKEVIGSMGKGILILLGISKDDTEADIDYLAEKIINLRIFPDKEGKMNLSLKDIQGEIMIVSQFTLYADTSRGNRPSFTNAASKEISYNLYEKFVHKIKKTTNLKVETGKFGEIMEVELINEGPVTIILESKSK